MCNSYDIDTFKPIAKTGYGWKVFEVRDGELVPFFRVTSYQGNSYIKTRSGAIKWDNKFYGDGFCFHMTRKEARGTIKDCYIKDKAVVRKIKYSGGLGKTGWGEREYLALCKEFTILDIRG